VSSSSIIREDRFLALLTSAIALLCCFSASSKVRSTASILKIGDKPPGQAECGYDNGEGGEVGESRITFRSYERVMQAPVISQLLLSSSPG